MTAQAETDMLRITADTMVITNFVLRPNDAGRAFLNTLSETDQAILSEAAARIIASNDLPNIADMSEHSISDSLETILGEMSDRPEYKDYIKDMQAFINKFMRFWNVMKNPGSKQGRVDRITCYEGEVWFASRENPEERPSLLPGEMVVIIGNGVERTKIPSTEPAPVLPAAKEPAQGEEVAGQIAARKALVIKAAKSALGVKDAVKVLVAVDEGMDGQAICNAVNKKLQTMGFGILGDNKQVVPYVRVKGDAETTLRNYNEARKYLMEDLNRLKSREAAQAQAQDGINYILVSFTDEPEDRFDPEKYKTGVSKEGDIYVVEVPDAYTDCNIEENKYPDVEYRAMLARHIAFCAVRSANPESLALLKDIFDGAVSNNLEEAVKIDGGRLIFLKPIKIKPVYVKLEEWKTRQKELDTSV